MRQNYLVKNDKIRVYGKHWLPSSMDFYLNGAAFLRNFLSLLFVVGSHRDLDCVMEARIDIKLETLSHNNNNGPFTRTLSLLFGLDFSLPLSFLYSYDSNDDCSMTEKPRERKSERTFSFAKATNMLTMFVRRRARNTIELPNKRCTKYHTNFFRSGAGALSDSDSRWSNLNVPLCVYLCECGCVYELFFSLIACLTDCHSFYHI